MMQSEEASDSLQVRDSECPRLTRAAVSAISAKRNVNLADL